MILINIISNEVFIAILIFNFLKFTIFTIFSKYLKQQTPFE